MSHRLVKRTVEILLVEDNPGDIRLTQEALCGEGVFTHLNVMSNGEDALAFLKREAPYTDSPRPDLILLDLNLPRKDGREVLAEIKEDPSLRRIPVIVLTTSQSEEDILRSYDLHVNSYVTKPMELNRYMEVIRNIEMFWLSTAQLPPPCRS